MTNRLVSLVLRQPYQKLLRHGGVELQGRSTLRIMADAPIFRCRNFHGTSSILVGDEDEKQYRKILAKIDGLVEHSVVQAL